MRYLSSVLKAMVMHLQNLIYKEVTVLQDNSLDKDKVEIRKDYYNSGALHRETPYVNGEKQGIERDYYESGALWYETPYVNGNMHGIAKGYYYESGALWRETPYVNGRMHGIDKEYYESGDLDRETPYDDGKMHGIEKYYGKDTSNIDCIILYNKDREVLTLCCESYGAASTKS